MTQATCTQKTPAPGAVQQTDGRVLQVTAQVGATQLLTWIVITLYKNGLLSHWLEILTLLRLQPRVPSGTR